MTGAPSPAEREPTRAEALLATLESLVKFDIRTLFDENSSLLPVAAWPPDAALAVSAITSRELFIGSGADRKLIGVEHRVKFNDRSKSLELSMKQMGLFDERNQGLGSPRTLEEMSDEELEAMADEGERAEDRLWAVMSDDQLDERLAHFQELHAKYRRVNATGLICHIIDGVPRDPRDGAVIDADAPQAAAEPVQCDVPDEPPTAPLTELPPPSPAPSAPQRIYNTDDCDITVPPRDPWLALMRAANGQNQPGSGFDEQLAMLNSMTLFPYRGV